MKIMSGDRGLSPVSLLSQAGQITAVARYGKAAAKTTANTLLSFPITLITSILLRNGL